MSARERQARREAFQKDFSGRGRWYLLTGFLIGFIAGIIYARAIQPVRYVNTVPSVLSAPYKDQYRLLVSEAYAANNDLVRARARLEQLGEEDPIGALIQQAQRIIGGDGPEEDARVVDNLAKALQFGPIPSPTPSRAAGTPTLENLP